MGKTTRRKQGLTINGKGKKEGSKTKTDFLTKIVKKISSKRPLFKTKE